MKRVLVAWLLLYEGRHLCQNKRVGKKFCKRSFIGLQVYITSTCEQPRSRRWHKAFPGGHAPHTVLPESGRGRRTAAGRRRRQNSVRLDWSGVEEAGNQVSKLSSFFQFLREGHHKVGKSCAPELERLISVSLCGWFIFRERESECSCVWILPFCLLLLQSKDREAP
jgi:hypothetical protein